MVHWSEIHVEWLKRISPEDFSERELYIVSDAELGPGYRSDGFHAWVSRAGGKRFRSHLERTGLWRGEGDVITVCDSWFQLDRSAADGTLVHELGHALDHRGREPLISDETISSVLRSDRERVASGIPIPLGKRSHDPEWVGHGHSWIRAAIHLTSRATVHHGYVGFAGEFYGLSSSLKYIEALGNEPWRLRNLPIAEILKTPAPTPFTELFERDTKPVAVAG